MMHMRRYFYKALDSDQERMGKALHLIAKLYGVEDRAKGLSAEERLALRQRLSAPVMAKLHAYLLRIGEEVLPKSPGARAVRYALNQWDAQSSKRGIRLLAASPGSGYIAAAAAGWPSLPQFTVDSGEVK